MKQPSWRKDKGTSTERGYTHAWRKARNAYLAANPLCVMCRAMKPPRITVADVVNHVVPHRGDEELFWCVDNWQAVCASHHNSDIQMAERSGRIRAKFDENGRVEW